MKGTIRRIRKFFRSENMIFVFILWSFIMLTIGVTFKSDKDVVSKYAPGSRNRRLDVFGVPPPNDADYFEDHLLLEYNLSKLSDSKISGKTANVSQLSKTNLFRKERSVAIFKKGEMEDYTYSELNLTQSGFDASDVNKTEKEPETNPSDNKNGGGIVINFRYRPVLIPLYRNRKFNYPLQTDMVELVSDFKQSGEVFFQPINIFKYNIIKNCVSKCNLKYSTHKILMFVIKTAVRNFENRQVIRETWGNETVLGGYEIKRVFMVGQTNLADIESEIVREFNMYKDIVQYDFYDSYYNNTLKTIGAINWITTYCKQAPIVLFVDDDYFVSPRNLISSLYQLYEGELKYLYMGHVSKLPRPARQKNGKWYVPLREFPYERYPPFINAGSYVMSMRILMDFKIAIRYTQFFRLDDVFLGIVAHKLQLQLLHNEHFLTKKINMFQELYTVITSHGFKDTTELRYAWKYHTSLIG